MVALVGGSNEKPLPLEFGLERARLSHLPVAVDSAVSCSCWTGPRGQVQRKYKFRIINNSDSVLQIGGGTTSQIRLLVAYPGRTHPPMSLPVAAPDDEYDRFGAPGGTDLRIATHVTTGATEPSQGRKRAVRRARALLDLDAAASAEQARRDAGNRRLGHRDFPDCGRKTRLLPGEGYSSPKIGHGSWTFYVPLPKPIAGITTAPLVPVAPDADIERYVIFVGIGIFTREGRNVADLLGFVPSPPDSGLLDPSEF